MSDQNGITNSPFGQPACPTPGESDGFGGSGFDLGSGDNGIVSSPYGNAVAPAPTGQPTGGMRTAPALTDLTDAPAPGTSLAGDITTRTRTIDKS